MGDNRETTEQGLPVYNELARHRAPSTNTRAIRALNARHREIMRRIALGERNKDIAEDLGMSQVSISIIVNSPLFKQELAKWMSSLDAQAYDAMGELRKIIPDAVVAVRETIEQKELPVLRHRASMDLLNRTGISTPKEYHVTKQQTSYEELLHSVRIKYQSDELDRKPPAIVVDSSEDEDDE